MRVCLVKYLLGPGLPLTASQLSLRTALHLLATARRTQTRRPSIRIKRRRAWLFPLPVDVLEKDELLKAYRQLRSQERFTRSKEGEKWWVLICHEWRLKEEIDRIEAMNPQSLSEASGSSVG